MGLALFGYPETKNRAQNQNFREKKKKELGFSFREEVSVIKDGELRKGLEILL